MKRWEKFKTFKQRGEWVELQFMATAALHGYHVLKPWGDSWEYDVGIEHGGDLLRVQVKSSAARNGTGYRCEIGRSHLGQEPYNLNEIDVFAIYVIPVATWYLIPAAEILTPIPKSAVMLYPAAALKEDRYKYELYREAWGLLGKDRSELLRSGKHR